jgi:hypothetical protein
MKKRQLISGVVSLGLALILTLLNFTKIETSFGETFLANVRIYPAAFFALLGGLLIYLGLKPLWRS